MNRIWPDERNDADRLFNNDATREHSPHPDWGDPVSAGAPWVGVHVLSEFVYCRRAGQIAFEQPGDDSGEECLAPRLDYLPNYDLQLIREELDRVRRPLTNLLLCSVPALAIWLYVLLQVHYATGVIIAIGLMGTVGPEVARMLRVYFILRQRLHAATIAPAIGLKFDTPIEQLINWWGLIKSGFESIQLRDPLRDPVLKLIGRPWRVLQYGPHRIPVIRRKQGDQKLNPQHYVRLAAYAHLIETCEGANVPFGIVLFGESNDGIAVPLTAELKERFQRPLSDLRRQLQSIAVEQLVPAPPESPHRCLHCPCAALRWTVPGQSESQFRGQAVSPYPISVSNSRKIWHCDCGDRFRWRPPNVSVRD